MDYIIAILERLVKLMKEVQEISGGRKRGQLVFWIVFIIGVIIASRFAYDSLDYVWGKLNIVPDLPNIMALFFVALITVVIAMGIAGIAGALLGSIISAIFAPYTTSRIDSIFSKLMPILRSANLDTSLQNDAETLYMRWNNSRITKFTRWIAPKERKEKKKK